jgi:hypothetical protein
LGTGDTAKSPKSRKFRVVKHTRTTSGLNINPLRKFALALSRSSPSSVGGGELSDQLIEWRINSSGFLSCFWEKN